MTGPEKGGAAARPVVEIVDAMVRFGDARAVDGVTLSVAQGEVLALVGESGSGKTTLIRAVQGLQRLTPAGSSWPILAACR